MKGPNPRPHPGPFRVMKVDAEFAGVLVAAAFFVMGFVSVPIAKGFLVGAFLLGIGIALILWLIRNATSSSLVDRQVLHIDQKPSAKR
jgi:hypothetical protein